MPKNPPVQNSLFHQLWLESERKRATDIAFARSDVTPELVAMALSLARLAAQREIGKG